MAFDLCQSIGQDPGVADVVETIPEELRSDVEAAVSWFNEWAAESFEVTGILDPDRALASGDSRDLHLVLCGGDRCEQRSFRVRSTPRGSDVMLLEQEGEQAAAKQAELDPPPGALRSWIDRVRREHAFVLLLFYRGFW